MNINDKIRQVLDLSEYITVIDVTPIAYEKITQDTLDMLEKRGVQLRIRKGIKEFCMYTHKTDCFAYKTYKCDALNELDCVGCSFYKPKESFKPLR